MPRTRQSPRQSPQEHPSIKALGEYRSRVEREKAEAERERAAPTEEVLERRLSDADKLFAAPTPADFAPVLGMQI